MRRRLPSLLLLAFLGVAASYCIVIIDEREVAFRTILNESDPMVFGLHLNQPVLDRPGWYIRIPFLHQLYRYEGRSMRYDRGDPLELQTSEKLLIEVDYYAVWRIADPELYFKRIRTRDAAIRRIDTVTYSSVQQTLAKHTLAELLSEDREEITRTIAAISRAGLAPEGIDIQDLRIRRTVYPEANLPQIYGRMRTERNRFAMKFRAEGEEQARAIRSNADQESLIIVSTAGRDAAKLRGDGDAGATRIYAEAYGKDREFYEFLRSLGAYRLALNNQTTLILSPDAPFLKYLFEPAAPPAIRSGAVPAKRSEVAPPRRSDVSAPPAEEALASDRGPEALASDRGPEALASDRGPEALASDRGPEALASDRGPEALASDRGPEALASDRGPEAPASDRGPEAPASDRGPEAVASERGPQAAASDQRLQ